MYNNQIIIQENENSLFINVPLLSSKNKEIIFELKLQLKIIMSDLMN